MKYDLASVCVYDMRRQYFIHKYLVYVLHHLFWGAETYEM